MSLRSITVDTNNKNYSSDNGVLYNKDKTALICCPVKTKMTSFVIPSRGNIKLFNCSFVNCATLFLLGTPEPFSIPKAFLIKTAAGGVFVIKLKERSA